MIVGVPKETTPGERRVGLVPDALKVLSDLGIELVVQTGAGLESGFDDAAYEAAGAKLETDAKALLGRADLVVKVQPPAELADGSHEIDAIRTGAAFIGFLKPLDLPDVARRFARRNITAFSMELMPRISRAQSMDALSAMSTISGYRAVLLGAAALPKIFPMLVTAAGTISPARVLVIGAGVAGLQAIATARRLGAVVEAYDTRPDVKEQVESLGARFVELDLDAGDAQDAGGYAKAQSDDFYLRQQEALAKRMSNTDVVITTALVPGQPAPVLISEAAVVGMKSGSVIVDLAAEKGGNCECTEPDQDIVAHGVTIIGRTNLPAEIPANASQMYTKNVVTFLKHLAPEGELVLDLEDEITRGAMLTHEGEITNDAARALAEGAEG